MLTKMCGARSALCALATLLKTALFHAEFEVFILRGSLKNPKKVNRASVRHDYGEIHSDLIAKRDFRARKRREKSGVV